MVYLGETIRWQNQFQDFPTKGEASGSYITPSTHSISLVDPDGVEVFSETSPNMATDTDGHAYNYVDIDTFEFLIVVVGSLDEVPLNHYGVEYDGPYHGTPYGDTSWWDEPYQPQ